MPIGLIARVTLASLTPPIPARGQYQGAFVTRVIQLNTTTRDEDADGN